MLCLRIHRGIEAHHKDPDWLQAKAEQAIRFFESDLVLHFKAEEGVLFPAMQSFPSAREVIKRLLREHRKIERLIKKLRQTDGRRLLNPLRQFADLLEVHIRQEERLLFPIYEQQISSELSRKVGEEINALIGPALQPRNPELLK